MTDAVVIEMRDLREQRHLTYQQLIEWFSQRTPPVKLTYHVVRAICRYKRRPFTHDPSS